MVAITGGRHRAQGGRAPPYLVYLRHPTTGGGFRLLGVPRPRHLGATRCPRRVSRAPPRLRGLYGEPFPPDGVQTAENLVRTTVVDDVVEPEALAGRLSSVLRLLALHESPKQSNTVDAPRPTPPGQVVDAEDAWASVLATREPRRAGLIEFLAGVTRRRSPMRVHFASR